MRAWRAFGLALLLGAVACGGGTTVVAIHPQVGVQVTPADALPFDPRAARLESAANQLAQLAGRRVELDIDAAIVDGDPASFQESLGQTLENLARDLDELGRSGASREKVQLARVELRYVAGQDHDDARFDPSSKTLTVRGPARRGALIQRGVLGRSLREVDAQQQTRAYGSTSADSVATGERRAYFKALVDGVGRPKSRDAKPLAESWEAERILSMLRLHELSSQDAGLRADITKWLLGETSWFVQAYLHKPDEVVAAAENSPFRRAEKAYGAWLVAIFPQAGADDGLRIAQAMFPPRFLDSDTRKRAEVSPWPGVDRFAFSLGVVDQWRKAGHPGPDTPRALSPAQGHIVCVRGVSASGASMRARCNDDFVRFATADAAGRKRLAEAMIERNDAAWTEQVFQALGSLERDGNALRLAMLQAVEKSPSTWSAALRVLAEDWSNSQDRLLLEEAQRLWLQYPQRRGAVLDLLAHLDYYGRGNVDWRGFANAFGDKIGAADLQSYLAQRPSTAIALVTPMVPALATGYSRAALLEPALGAYLDAKADGKLRNFKRPYDVINELFGALCMHKADADIRALGAYLQRRSASRPGEPYGSFASYGNPGECKAAAVPSGPVRNEVKLVPATQRGVRAEDER